jgi:hypothetical protein
MLARGDDRLAEAVALLQQQKRMRFQVAKRQGLFAREPMIFRDGDE